MTGEGSIIHCEEKIIFWLFLVKTYFLGSQFWHILCMIVCTYHYVLYCIQQHKEPGQ